MEIVYRDGDIIVAARNLIANDNYVTLVHGCNNVGAWGAGFTATLDRVWPSIGEDFRKDFQHNRHQHVTGYVYWTEVEKGNIFIANLITQDGLRSTTNVAPFVLSSLKGFLEIAKHAQADQSILCSPRIGAGLGGGNWDEIAATIEDIDVDYTLHVYTL